MNAEAIALMNEDVKRQYKNQGKTVSELRGILADIQGALSQGAAPSTVQLQAAVSMMTRFAMDNYATQGREHALAFTTREN
jgi:hypothetical protein